jgi:hypothetical protein
MLAGQRRFAAHQLSRSSSENYFAAVVPGIRSQVDGPVGVSLARSGRTSSGIEGN